MSSRAEGFECRWQASRTLLVLYVLAQLLAWTALLLADIGGWSRMVILLACLGHGVWVLPRQILLTHPDAYRGLRHTAEGWQLWNARQGWQAVQLRADSLALPLLVVLRFRRAGQWWARGLCIPRDSLPRDLHRRLRVRLKFSRRRWAAAE